MGLVVAVAASWLLWIITTRSTVHPKPILPPGQPSIADSHVGGPPMVEGSLDLVAALDDLAVKVNQLDHELNDLQRWAELLDARRQLESLAVDFQPLDDAL